MCFSYYDNINNKNEVKLSLCTPWNCMGRGDTLKFILKPND
jgi:hypothetical protein